MRNDNCIFCKIAKGDIPSKTIFENDMFRVILDLKPATKGHVLILSKEHAANLYELRDETAKEVLPLAKRLMTQMKERLNCDGFNVVQNNEEAAGQTVFHFHMHLIPRYKNDKQRIGWDMIDTTQNELEEVRKQIIG